MPEEHWPEQYPFPTGAQADPAGKPSAAQSASFWQSAHAAISPNRGPRLPQKLLPAVVV
jgi:hypothetical protein